MRTKPKIKVKDKANATIKSNTTQVDTLSQLKPTDYRGSISAVPWGQVAARLWMHLLYALAKKIKQIIFQDVLVIWPDASVSIWSRMNDEHFCHVIFSFSWDETLLNLSYRISWEEMWPIHDAELRWKASSTAAGGQSKPRMLPGTKFRCNMKTFSY